MPKEERKKLEKTFREIDADGNGTLSRDELITAFKKLGKTEADAIKQVDELIKSLNVSPGTPIEYTQFMAAITDKKKLLTKENVKHAFDLFDTDKSGSITPDEVKKLLGGGKEIPEETWNEIVKEMDPDNDGKIAYKEFEEMLLKGI